MYMYIQYTCIRVHVHKVQCTVCNWFHQSPYLEKFCHPYENDRIQVSQTVHVHVQYMNIYKLFKNKFQ